ncbi:site-specific integrase [Vibrio sp. 10N.222.52.C3]|uniref:site-specific integrase n=1 Tax=unclassified Vibrio TaxID=2614977 RepID=UPI003552A7AA
MGRQSNEKKRNRANNAGGVPVDAYNVALAIANVLHELRPKTSGVLTEPTTPLNLYHIYFLYLWIAGHLSGIEREQDIPDLVLVSGRVDCALHHLRRVREGGVSWVEYAIPCALAKETVYLWQPMPDALNAVFSYWLTHHDTELRLTKMQKKQLFWRLKKRKLRTPEALRSQLVLRKDLLYSYIERMAHCDPYLSLPAQKLITAKKVHHHSALSYQMLNCDQIRYEIFCAHNRYLQRLIPQINQRHIKPFCDVRLPTTGALIPVFTTLNERPPYLKKAGAIVAFTLELTEGARTYIPIPPISIGSTRAIPIPKLSLFFGHLRQQLATVPERNASQDALREYYNARTYELALLFVLLTGARPTHHISIEREACFDLQRALIKDKGRYRLIDIPNYLRQAIESYLKLQARVLQTLAPNDASAMGPLWYLIDENNVAVPLTAKTLRLFMHAQWQHCFQQRLGAPEEKVVPYQLRHSFAQHALMATHPRLTTQQIDVLMGHSELGEHLGSAYAFQACNQTLIAHLNHWPSRLQLSALTPYPSKKDRAL